MMHASTTQPTHAARSVQLSDAVPALKRPRFAEVSTVHVGTVQWWWAHGRVHDDDYKNKVNDAVRLAMAAALLRHDVREDTRFCCQWEGVCVEGADLNAVTAAINDISLALSRFKDVIGLSD